MMETEFREESVALSQRVVEHAARRGMSAADLAMRWVMNNRLVSSVLAGPRTLAQWEGYLGALRQGFTAEDEAFFDGLVRTGHASAPGYVDPRYPPRGRRPRT